LVGHVHQNYVCLSMCETHVMKSWARAFLYHLSSAFLFVPLHVWSYLVSQEFPKHSSNLWTTCKKPKLVQYATLQKLVSLVLYPQGYINFAKTYVALCYIPRLCQFCKNLCHLYYYIPSYVNFAKAYVTCVISQAMSICKYLCYLCYIPRLHQFCKNLCHLCYIPSYVNFANTYVTCVTSQGYINFAKTFVTCVISQATSILQNPMTLVWYLRLCQFCKNLYHLCYILGYVNFAKIYVICVISQATSILQNPMLI